MTTVAEASRMVNIQQAMSIAGVSRRTIYNWLAQGKLTTVRTASGQLRIARESLFRSKDGISPLADASDPPCETDSGTLPTREEDVPLPFGS